MKKVYILALLTFMGHNSQAQISPFQTTRLLATGGAGVGSILATEAAILNPATAAFFKGSSLAYHRLTTSLKKESQERKSLNKSFKNGDPSQGFFVADHSGPLKGGTAYISQELNGFKRESYILHAAAPIGKTSAMGVSYQYLQDERSTGPKRHFTHHRSSIGLVHILDEKTILGMTLIDPTLTTPGEERLIGGIQYTVADRLIVLGDIGTRFTQDMKQYHLWGAAAQINIFSDFFILLGRFDDSISGNKGTSWGISWVGPKLGLDFAQRFSKQYKSNNFFYKNEDFVQTALSAFIKF